MQEVMLTTVDNPFDPFTQWDEWLSFDHSNGHFTCEFLARVLEEKEQFGKGKIVLSKKEQNSLVEETIDEIVRLNVRGIDRKVAKVI